MAKGRAVYYGFRYFHPQKGQPPGVLTMYGEDIVFRARHLLRGWTLAQMKATLAVVNWILDSEQARELAFQELLTRVEAQRLAPRVNESGELMRFGQSAPAELMACRQSFDLSGYPHLKEPSWPALFAVLALALIDKACDDVSYFGAWPAHDEWLHDWRILDHVSGWLIEAMEAVTVAESLAREACIAEKVGQEVAGQLKAGLSKRNTQAAIARHAKTVDATLALYDFFRAGAFKSARQATQSFCEKFPEQVAHLAPTNRIRTMAERLGKQLKARPINRLEKAST